MDAACGFTSRIKAEVPYDMTRTPPAPYMSKNNPKRPTKSRPKDSRIPDVVIVKDGSLPPTQGNIVEIVEIKFPPDDWMPGQQQAYEEIAGDAPVTQLGPDECGCPNVKVPVPVPVPETKKQENKEKSEVSGKEVAVALAALAVVAGLLLAPEVTVPALVLAF